MSATDRCEDCGTVLLVGMELSGDAVDWCPNLQCPSNGAIPGLRRIGISSYRCLTCSEEFSGLSAALAQLRSH